MQRKCKNCGGELIDGPDQNRTAETVKFTVSVNRIPTKVCPRGCPGLYWYWPDLAEEVMDKVTSSKANIARKKGIFKAEPVCPSCGQDLQNSGGSNNLKITIQSAKGSPIEIDISGQMLFCSQCNVNFLPAPTNSSKAYYSELCNVIGKALVRELIGQ